MSSDLWGRLRKLRAIDFCLRILGQTNLGVKVFLGIMLLLLTTLGVVSNAYYKTMTQQLVDQYSQDMQMRIIQTNTIMDLQLSRIEDNSDTMLQDQDILHVMRELDPEDPYDVLSANRAMRRFMGKYFAASDWLYAYNILSKTIKLGQAYVPTSAVFASDLGRAILQAKGRLIWYPTFDFVEMFDAEFLSGVKLDFRHLFAAGRVFIGLDTTSVEGAQEIISFDDTYILLICFRESFFQSHYADLLQENDTMVGIVAPDGTFLSVSSSEVEQTFAQSDWLPDVLRAESGSRLVPGAAGSLILCYDTSAVTGWTLVSATRSRSLLANASSQLVLSVLGFILPLALLSLVLALLVSLAVTRPMRQLLRAIRRTGKGDFTSKIPVQGYGDFSRLIAQFNQMNDRIARLIDENYAMQLHEKESQIEALNAQLNPHFLYNTLNLINCMAIESNAQEIGGVVRALSKSLRYTVDNMSARGILRQELQWMENYVYIMACRYEDQLTYDCQIEETLLDKMVPRLFLQPFVENAFVHGFRNKQENCVLRISGYQEGDWDCFSIMDNGRGMDQTQLDAVLAGEGETAGIRNSYQRMRLMYDGHCQLYASKNDDEGATILIKLLKDRV